ncbi:hypothetical protein V6N13_142255 [Hibiscus sabdariffa]
MKGNVDVDRAIERLHGFILYGWKLSVQVARNRYVRKGNQEDRQQTNMAEPPRKGIDDQQKDYKVEAMIEKKIPAEFDFERENIKHITGHVENEELWKNGESLKKIVEIWGKVEALGVNANHTHDCEKATILITTRHVRRIEEMVELEVGENIFSVYVRELGFTDGTTYPLCNNRNGVKGNVENSEESESNSNVNLGEKIQAAEEGDRRNSGTKGEAHEALNAEKEFINGIFGKMCYLGYSLMSRN